MRLVVFALASAALLAAPPASAYCRTTTVKAPAGYNPAESGCWTQGVPLKWLASRTPYGVSQAASRQVTLADATRIADLAFETWNTVACPGTPSIQAYDDGPIAWSPDGGTDCASSTDCNPQAHDVIVFDDDGWPHDDPASILALTTVTYGVDDGTIFEAYTEVNTSSGMMITTQEPPPAGPARDLQSILTHEAGHFFGLAHATDTAAVMYAFYDPGRIQLTTDDTDAFCTVYPPAPPAKGCACQAGGRTGGAFEAMLGAVGLGLALAARVRRPRRSTVASA
jgi:hypothetical protein